MQYNHDNLDHCRIANGTCKPIYTQQPYVCLQRQVRLSKRASNHKTLDNSPPSHLIAPSRYHLEHIQTIIPKPIITHHVSLMRACANAHICSFTPLSETILTYDLAMGCVISKPTPPVPRPSRFPANWPDPRQFAVLTAQAEDERARLNISRASTHRAWNPDSFNRTVLRKYQDGSYRESGPKGSGDDGRKKLDYGVFGGVARWTRGGRT